MSGETFSAEWLALREPADHRARATELDAALRAEGSARGWARALDLGAGTGSNLRYLAPRLPFVSEWTLVDHDAVLLERAGRPEGSRTEEERPEAERTDELRAEANRPSPGGPVVRTVVGDLAHEGLERISDADLVTASALLDLVSETWLRTLVDRCADAGAAALFALTYDGRIEWRPAAPEDEAVREALNAHQLGDKGFGPALGPRAASVATELFEAAGYRTTLCDTPWTLGGPDDAELTLALLGGWVDAALEVAPERADGILAWRERREGDVHSGDYGILVGHRDLLALPPPT